MLLLIEGFEAFDNGSGATPVNMDAAYSVDTVSGFQIEDGRISGKCLEAQTNIEASRWIETPVLTTGDTLVFGAAYFFPTPGAAADRMLIEFRDGDGNIGMNVRLLSTNEFQVRRGTTVIASTTTEAVLDAWVYIEFKVVTHDSTGSYELRKNGVSILSGSGVDTKNGSGGGSGYHATVRMHSAASLMKFDDVYIDDSAFHGDRKVITIFPNAAGDDADFTPSSGSNYQAVDDVPHDGDTSYVESATTDHQDLYGVPTPSPILGVDGVQHNVVCRKTDATDFDIKPVCKSGATESVDSAQVVDSTTYTTKRRILENDPDTASAWDAAGIGAAQFGYRVG